MYFNVGKFTENGGKISLFVQFNAQKVTDIMCVFVCVMKFASSPDKVWTLYNRFWPSENNNFLSFSVDSFGHTYS